MNAEGQRLVYKTHIQKQTDMGLEPLLYKQMHSTGSRADDSNGCLKPRTWPLQRTCCRRGTAWHHPAALASCQLAFLVAS